MTLVELEAPWSSLRRHVNRFEHALAQLPEDLKDHGSLQTQLDVLTRSVLDQAIDALVQLRGLVPTAYDQLNISLSGTLSRRLDASEVKLDVYTRLALWERLWLNLQRDRIESFSENQCWARCVTLSSAIARIGWQLKSDPLWSPAHVYEQRHTFYAEEAIAQLINSRRDELCLTVDVAPLDADILHGLDLSIKRSQPKARGWIQFSLSAEGDLNLKKLSKVRRSAAIALLSPWTLAQYLRDQPRARQHLFWEVSGEGAASSLQTQARLITRSLVVTICMSA